MSKKRIVLKKVFVNNLKGVDLEVDHHKFVVFTGVSGSGKSSLAFDTIFCEGQRRYIETLPEHNLRRLLKELPKPEAEKISGLSPTVAIEQKSLSNNPRSTVGTITGIYDFLRLLFAKIGIPHCPVSGEVVEAQSREKIIKTLQKLPLKTKIILLSPYIKQKKGSFKDELQELLRKGFTRARIDGNIVDLSEKINLDPKAYHNIDIVIDRIEISEQNFSQVAESATLALEVGKGSFLVHDVATNEEKFFSEYAYSPKSDLYYPPLQAHDFSFNHPLGMCPKCHGMGEVLEFDVDLIINPKLSIAEDCCSIAGHYNTVLYKNIYDNLARMYGFSVTTPWEMLPEKAKKVFLFGSEKKWLEMHFVHPIKKKRWDELVRWEGVIKEGQERFIKAQSTLYRQKMEKLMKISRCSDCQGERIKPYPAATTVGDKRISELCNLSIDKFLHFLQSLKLSDIENLIGSEIIKEIHKRGQFLLDVGLHYLTLNRNSPSMSGGEAQRVKLASQIGAGLIGTTYILDEPSIGLHPKDHGNLLKTLKDLRDQGNTVIVVEHDRATMQEADLIVDVGPLGGKGGGKILAKGTFSEIVNSPDSLTGKYLKGILKIPVPEKRRKAQNFLKIYDVSHNNLKNIDVEIPLSLFVCITGVSGSGKSSLISDTLFPAIYNHINKSSLSCGKYDKIEGLENINKIIFVDQSPIGRTPRSNLATFTKLFDDIRDLFATLIDSQVKGYKKGHFSFNVKEGHCPYCKGLGEIKIDMDFLEDEKAPCPQCKGERFSPEILTVQFKGKNINDILKMEVKEAKELFAAIPTIFNKLELLSSVGLDYLPLGQSATTLSGGEAQRIKLSKELMRPDTGKTLYVLDEPTSGLHFHDIKKLIDILQHLVDRGNSVIVIEHNMDFVKVADHIIELGPEGGDRGGKLIASATPEKIAKLNTPTAPFIKEALTSSQESLSRIESKTPSAPIESIKIIKASQNNLKEVNATIPRGQMTIFTGPSGSGKSSLAFDTIYAEGQRRYLETLPPYLRQLFQILPKAKVEKIEGLSPSIAIEQKGHSQNPRSTVGTMTEVYDLLRLLFAKIGIPHCPETGEELEQISKETAVERILKNLTRGEKIEILAPLTLQKKVPFKDQMEDLQKKGFLRIRLNGQIFELDEKIAFDEGRKNELFLVIDRLLVKEEMKERLLESITLALQFSKDTFVVATKDKDFLFNLSFASKSGKSYHPITPQTFSFNSEEGMCLECQGLGSVFGATIASDEDFLDYCIDDCVDLLFKGLGGKFSRKIFLDYFKEQKINIFAPLKELSQKALHIFFNGSSSATFESNGLLFQWKGLNPTLSFLAKHGPREVKELLRPMMEEKSCPACFGKRLNPLARAVTIEKQSLPDICSWTIDKLCTFIEELFLKEKVKFLQDLLANIKGQLAFLMEIGLHYLSLERSLNTLSGGEAQRVRLSRQLGGGLVDCLYILDEPTIGLHPHNCDLLNKALKKLRDLGNTLIIVEHDPMTLKEGNYFLEFGPKAGREGGQLIASGSLQELKNNPNSLTGAYLSGKKRIPVPKERKSSSEKLIIKKANLHNIHDLSVAIPCKGLTTICGVSGSGKSTLIGNILKPALELSFKQRERQNSLITDFVQIEGTELFNQLIYCSQAPIGHTGRGDVATYSEILPILRKFLAELPAAKVKGLRGMHFSYHHIRGMCRNCWGMGYKTIDLQFLPRVQVTCEICKGFRLNSRALEVRYQGKHLGEILDLTVEEALSFFALHPKIMQKLQTLKEVGLEYLKLNQEIMTLSGGEGQRLKLSKELSKRSKGKTLYVFDEPTIGLHSEDVAKLLKIFHHLAEKNALLVIEHNLDVIANSDFLIEMGPGAGKDGGKITAQGTPEEIAQNSNSITGQYLKSYLG